MWVLSLICFCFYTFIVTTVRYFQPVTEPGTNSYDDLLSLLNNMNDNLKAIACDHLLHVAKDFLKSQSTTGVSATVISQVNLSFEEAIEEEYHEAVTEIVNEKSGEFKSVSKLQVHCSQAADTTSPKRTSFNADQTLNISKASENEANNKGDKSNLHSENDFVKVEPVRGVPIDDSQPEADKNMEEDIAIEKVKAFHERIGYSPIWFADRPSSSCETSFSTAKNIPSFESAKSQEKPQTEPLVSTNCPSTSADGQTPVKPIEKSEEVCQSPKPKRSVVSKPIDFKTDSIFSSTEFVNFFSDLNFSFTQSWPTSGPWSTVLYYHSILLHDNPTERLLKKLLFTNSN